MSTMICQCCGNENGVCRDCGSPHVPRVADGCEGCSIETTGIPLLIFRRFMADRLSELSPTDIMEIPGLMGRLSWHFREAIVEDYSDELLTLAELGDEESEA